MGKTFIHAMNTYYFEEKSHEENYVFLVIWNLFLSHDRKCISSLGKFDSFSMVIL